MAPSCQTFPTKMFAYGSSNCLGFTKKCQIYVVLPSLFYFFMKTNCFIVSHLESILKNLVELGWGNHQPRAGGTCTGGLVYRFRKLFSKKPSRQTYNPRQN